MFTYALPGEHTRPPKDVAMHCKKSKFQTECMYALTISNNVLHSLEFAPLHLIVTCISYLSQQSNCEIPEIERLFAFQISIL